MIGAAWVDTPCHTRYGGDMDKELTVEEAAKHLNVSQRSVRRWLSDGTLPYVKVVGRVRIRRDDLDALRMRVDARGGAR